MYYLKKKCNEVEYLIDRFYGRIASLYVVILDCYLYGIIIDIMYLNEYNKMYYSIGLYFIHNPYVL